MGKKRAAPSIKKSVRHRYLTVYTLNGSVLYRHHLTRVIRDIPATNKTYAKRKLIFTKDEHNNSYNIT